MTATLHKSIHSKGYVHNILSQYMVMVAW